MRTLPATFGPEYVAILKQMWLRDRAKVLTTAASKSERAYTKGPMFEVCQYTAAAYREAAKVLTDAADRAEAESAASGTGSADCTR
jgi:hypothetical protein